jgi:YggT family protein
MGNQIAQLLIETVFGLFIYIVLLRFWMQVLRAPFRNPIGQFVIALSDWAVLPLRRIVPSFRGYDLASLMLAWVAEILMLFVLALALAGGKVPAPLLMLVESVVALVRYSLHLLILVIVIQVLFSWFNPGSPIAYVFNSLTRPFYDFFRRFIPPIGSVDLSPLVIVVLAQVLLIVLRNAPYALLASG